MVLSHSLEADTITSELPYWVTTFLDFSRQLKNNLEATGKSQDCAAIGTTISGKETDPD